MKITLTLFILIAIETSSAKTVIHPETGAELEFADTKSNRAVNKNPCHFYQASHFTSGGRWGPRSIYSPEEQAHNKNSYIELAMPYASHPFHFPDPVQEKMYDCRLSWQAPVMEASRRCSSETFKTLPAIISLEKQILKDGRWCQSQIPKDKEELLSLVHDVPADFINLWTGDYIKNRWSEVQSSRSAAVIDESHPEFQVILDDIVRLPSSWVRKKDYMINHEAQTLRSRSGHKVITFEEAKREFALERLQNSLGRGPDYKKYSEDSPTLLSLNLQAAQLWKKMVNCSGDANQARVNYSSASWQSTACPQLEIEIANFIVNLKNAYETAEIQVTTPDLSEIDPSYSFLVPSAHTKRAPLPSMHPLFVQVALQYAVTTIGVGQKRSFKQFVRELKRKIKSGEMTSSFYINSTQIFNMLPYPSCTSHGLWPSAGLTAVKAIQRQATETLFNYDFADPGLITSMCKDTAGNIQTLPQIYQDHSDDVALAFARITDRYMETLKKK